MLMSKIFKLLPKQLIPFLLFAFLVSCGDPLAGLPGGSRDAPADGRERARKNLEEGKGITLGSNAVKITWLLVAPDW